MGEDHSSNKETAVLITNPPTAAAAAAKKKSYRLVIMILMFVLMTALPVGWMWYTITHPILPQEFRLDSLSLHSLNVSQDSHHLTTHWSATFTVRNPNSDDGIFKHLQASILYRGISLSTSLFSSLDLHAHEEGGLTVTGNSVWVPFEGSVLGDMEGDRSRLGAVNFAVKVRGVVSMMGDIDGQESEIVVDCEDVTVRFSSSSSTTTAKGGGTMVGEPRVCHVSSH